MAPGETRNGWKCPDNGAYYICSFADAVHYQLDSSIATKRGYASGIVTGVKYGVIALTTDSATLWNYSGGLQIDSTTNREMEGENGQSNQIVGDVVHKVGAATGHTYGPITRTCTHIATVLNAIETYRILCQNLANFYSQGGDSGAPVWYLGIYLEGITWGSLVDPDSGGTTRSIVSPIDYVHKALYDTHRFCFYCSTY